MSPFSDEKIRRKWYFELPSSGLVVSEEESVPRDPDWLYVYNKAKTLELKRHWKIVLGGVVQREDRWIDSANLEDIVCSLALCWE